MRYPADDDVIYFLNAMLRIAERCPEWVSWWEAANMPPYDQETFDVDLGVNYEFSIAVRNPSATVWFFVFRKESALSSRCIFWAGRDPKTGDLHIESQNKKVLAKTLGEIKQRVLPLVGQKVVLDDLASV